MALPDIPRGQGRFRGWRFRPPELTAIQRQLQTSPDQFAIQEAEMQRHRGIVAQGVLGILDKYDRIVADRIGFDGNIRQTLLANNQLLGEGPTIEGLSPFLDLQARHFSVNKSALKGSPLYSYTIDSPVPDIFMHALVLRQDDGILHMNVYQREANDYSEVGLMKYIQRDVKGLTTFTPHRSGEGGNHPIRVQPTERTELYYDGIDSEGNTTLSFWVGQSSGEFSTRRSQLFPIRRIPRITSFGRESHITEDGRLEFTDYNGRLCRAPLVTNIYKELQKLIPDMSFPVLQQ